MPPHTLLYREIVHKALREDLEHGDLTTSITVDPSVSGPGVIVAREACVCAGLFVAEETFRQLCPDIKIARIASDGKSYEKGSVFMELHGPLYHILQGERVALNFLQRMCGISTLTSMYVKRIAGTGCRLCDTRKTTPGLRLLEKYAVRAGGGFNHRYSLADGILIKDNHIAACGGVGRAVKRALEGSPHGLKVEVEVSDMEMLKEAVRAGATVLLLDNMEVSELSEAVETARSMSPDIILEASGNITLSNIRDYALTGVDIISSGALTHSYSSMDLSLRIQQ